MYLSRKIHFYSFRLNSISEKTSQNITQENLPCDEIKINSTVAEILQKFDLIMISDYMDQSLILLKNELGWNIEDILYFSINKRFDF